MAIAYDTSTELEQQTSATTHSWSHTCSGTDRVLVVTAMAHVTGLTATVTYGGVAMTAVTNSPVDNLNEQLWLFYLVNPASGSNTVEVTFSSACQPVLAAVSITGSNGTVDVSGMTNTGTVGAGGTFGTQLTTTVANTLNVTGGVLANASGTTPLILAADTQDLRQSGVTATNAYSGGTATKSHSSTGAKDIRMTNNDSGDRRTLWGAVFLQEGTQVSFTPQIIMI